MGGTIRVPKSLTPPHALARAAADQLDLYHGTSQDAADSIRQIGLWPARDGHPTLTTDRVEAEKHAGETGSPAILHFRMDEKMARGVMDESPGDSPGHRKFAPLTTIPPRYLAREAARWMPSAGIFGPTTGLDPRLFDEHGHLYPEVRHDVMTRLDQCIRVDVQLVGSDWQQWMKVYLAGGSVSEWAGLRPNETAQDLDVLLVVDYDEARGSVSHFAGMGDKQIRISINSVLRSQFNTDGWSPSFGGTWNLTGYVIER